MKSNESGNVNGLLFQGFVRVSIHICIYANLLLGHHSLPNDYRSLLRTPRFIDLLPVGGGQLWYNGIGKSLKNIFSNLNEDISITLDFNMDGLPIFKSSQR